MYQVYEGFMGKRDPLYTPTPFPGPEGLSPGNTPTITSHPETVVG
jgi:hypothetical protein